MRPSLRRTSSTSAAQWTTADVGVSCQLPTDRMEAPVIKIDSSHTLLPVLDFEHLQAPTPPRAPPTLSPRAASPPSSTRNDTVPSPHSANTRSRVFVIPATNTSTLPAAIATRSHATGRHVADVARNDIPPLAGAWTASPSPEAEAKPKPKPRSKVMPGAPRISGKAAKRADGYTPRPPNAWILYRSQQIRNLKQDPELAKKPQSDISKVIGLMWRSENAETRAFYELQAEVKKAEHKDMYPDYRFSPVRKERVIERRGPASPPPSRSGRSDSTRRPTSLRNVQTVLPLPVGPRIPALVGGPHRAATLDAPLRHIDALANFLPIAADYPRPTFELNSWEHTHSSDIEAFVSSYNETYPTKPQERPLRDACDVTTLDAWNAFEASSPQWYPAPPLSAPAAFGQFSLNAQSMASYDSPPDFYSDRTDSASPPSTHSSSSSSSYSSPPYTYDTLDSSNSRTSELCHLEYYLPSPESYTPQHFPPMFSTPDFPQAFFPQHQ